MPKLKFQYFDPDAGKDWMQEKGKTEDEMFFVTHNPESLLHKTVRIQTFKPWLRLST